MVKPPLSSGNRLQGPSHINDNYCVNYVIGQKNSVCVTGQADLDPAPVVAGNSKVSLLTVNSCVANAYIVTGLPQRKGVNPMSNVHRNKICERCFLCRSLVFCKSCHQCPTCCYRSSCRGEVKPVLGEMGSPGFKSKSSHHTEGGLYSPVPVQTQLDKVTDCNKQLPQSNQTVLPCGGTSLCSRTGIKSKLTGFLQPAIFGTQTQQPLETGPGPESFKMETPETIRTSLHSREWVTSIDFKDAYFHIPIHSQSRKYMRFHLQGRSYQFKALPFGLSTASMEFTVVAKEIKLMALQKGIRTHQYLDDWLVRASTHDTCLQHTQTLVTLCQELGWLVNKEKSELVPK